MPKVTHVVIFRTGSPERFFLMTDAEDIVHGFTSETAALRYFEDAYNRKHRQSYEGSMSACIHSIFFQPSVIPMGRGMTKLEKLIARNEAGQFEIVTSSSVAGRMSGIRLKLDEGRAAWEKGTQPRLID